MMSKIFKISGILLGIVVLLVGVAYYFKNDIVQYTMNKNIKGIQEKYGLDISFSGVEIDGTDLTLRNLLVRKSEQDTLLFCREITGLVSKRSLINGKVKLKKLSSDGVYLNYVRGARDTSDLRVIDSSPDKVSKSYAEKVRYAVGFIGRMMPSDLVFKDVDMVVKMSDSLKARFTSDEISIKDGIYNSHFVFTENDSLSQDVHAEGKYDRDTHFFSTLLYSDKGDELKIPFIHEKIGAEITADSIKAWTSIRFEGKTNEESLRINGSIKSDSLRMYHRLVSDRKLNLGDLDISIHSLINKNKIEVDSSTTITMGNFFFSPYLSVEKDTSVKVNFVVNKERFHANDFFSSIPEGLMPTISGLQVSGDMSYHLALSFDMNNLDSLQFSVNAKKYPDFKIKKYGNVNLTYPNDTFTYNAYLEGKLMRRIALNDRNPNFVKYKDVPEEVINCILYSEDPSFFRHRGFLESATKESLIKNLKEKRFARGGSTISMQLVKNLFLNQNKNLMRKAEEAILVWLIEQNNLIPKERMLEIYVNVIEWGPNVYGLTEASRYYFDKSPSRLTPEEAIYLAMIIPRPRKFMYTFDNTGHLRDSYELHFSKIKAKLYDNNIVRDTSRVRLKDVKLCGEAKKMLKVTDTEVVKEEEEPRGIFKLFKRRRNR